ASARDWGYSLDEYSEQAVTMDYAMGISSPTDRLVVDVGSQELGGTAEISCQKHTSRFPQTAHRLRRQPATDLHQSRWPIWRTGMHQSRRSSQTVRRNSREFLLLLRPHRLVPNISRGGVLQSDAPPN